MINQSAKSTLIIELEHLVDKTFTLDIYEALEAYNFIVKSVDIVDHIHFDGFYKKEKTDEQGS